MSLKHVKQNSHIVLRSTLFIAVAFIFSQTAVQTAFADLDFTSAAERERARVIGTLYQRVVQAQHDLKNAGPAKKEEFRAAYATARAQLFAEIGNSPAEQGPALAMIGVNTFSGVPPEPAIADSKPQIPREPADDTIARLDSFRNNFEIPLIESEQNLKFLKGQYESMNPDDPRRAEIARQYSEAYNQYQVRREALATEFRCTRTCVESIGGYSEGYTFEEPAPDVSNFTDARTVAETEAAARDFTAAKEGLVDPDNVEAEYAEDEGVERIEDMEFSNNSLGKAGEHIVTVHNAGRCGSEEGQGGCESVARSMDTMSTISQVSDYTAYAAVAGTIAPMVIYSGDQKEDQEKVAKIQQVAGVANIAAGVVDLGIGAKARFSDARKLDSLSNAEKARCQAEKQAIEVALAKYKKTHEAFIASKGKTEKPNPTSVPKRTRSCDRFSAKAVAGAAGKVRDASNSHFLVGGIKALGGVASLYLAEQAKERAQNLGELEDAAEEEAAQQQAPTTVGLLGPTGVTNNDIGFVEPGPAGVVGSSTDTDPEVSAVPETGGSIAPTKRNIASLPKRGGGPGAGSPNAPKGGGLPSLGGGSGSIDPALLADSEDEIGEADSAVDFNGGGGGGFLNAGGTPLGGGDGGFGQMMGTMMKGLLGDNKKGGPAAAGASRTPAAYSGASRLPGKHASPDANIFERVKTAIDRQVNAGKVVNEVNDINQI